MEVYNAEGSAFSSTTGFILADIPSNPTIAPTSDITVTSTNIIKIDYTVITSNGGSPIISYSLEVDDGMGGNFVPLFGVNTTSLSLTYTFTNGV